MTEEDRHDDALAGTSPDNISAATVALGASSREKADAFLEEQTRLAREQTKVARLQAEDLRREDRLRHWSLRVRHISDVMKLTFEFGAAAIALAVLIGLGAILWTAAHDKGLVIQAFSVPPDMAARGLTGRAVAAGLQGRLAALQDATDSARPANTYANDWGNDIKVQIPDTGVSIGAFYQSLAS